MAESRGVPALSAPSTSTASRRGWVCGRPITIWVERPCIGLAEGSGAIVVNGAAARHFQRGDRIIIVAFVLTDEVIEPRMFLVDDENAFVAWLPAEGGVQLAGPLDSLLSA